MPQCTYDTEDDIDKESSTGEHLTLNGLHVDAVHPKPPPQLQPAATGHPAPAPARTEKINRPKLEMKEQWNFFTFSWQQYKTLASITGNEKERLGVCLGDRVACLVYSRLGVEKYKELMEDELLK